MFGNNNNNSTPFGGGGGFGQPQNNNNTFGTPGAGFGGAPAPSTFGAPQGGFGGFGAAPAPANTMFGGAPSNTGVFGAPAQSGFGGGGAFGGGQQQQQQQQQQPGLFGGQQQQQTGGFGTQSAFGTSQAGGFGANPAPAPFGATPSTPFGATPGAFGAPAQSTFGAPAPSAFGAPAPSMFGGAAPATNTGFGGSTFQAPAPAGGGLFGSTTPAPSLFGGGAPSTQGTSLFGGGQAPAPSGGFGTSTFGSPAAAPSTGLFGSAAPAPATGGFGASAGFGAPATGGGTKNVQFQSTSKQDGGNTITFQSISAMSQFQTKCHEELRVEDYSQGNKGTTSGPTSGFSAAPNPAPLFGSPAPAPGGFGSGFGAAPAPFMGSQPAPLGGSTFGAPAPSAFGAPAPSAFGAPAPSAFGAPAPSAFGAPAPSTLGGFGATSTFGNPAPAPLFGSAAPSPAFGGFGSPAPAPSGFGAAPSAFGAPAPSGGLFGQPAPAPAWGQPAPAPAWGQPAPAPAFGQPTSGGLFGNPAPAPSLFGQSAPAPSLFGQQAPAAPFGQQQAPMMQLNAQIIQPSSTEILNRSMEAMKSQQEELEKQKVWGASHVSSPSTTPTSVPERNPPLRSYGPRTPSSRIVPRGFPTSSKKTPSSTSFLRRDKAALSLLSPEHQIRSSALKLEVRPDSLRKPRHLALKLDSEDHPSEFIDPAPAETATSPATRDAERSLPPVSPAQEYYDQIVGNNATSPKAQASPDTVLPRMERNDYEVNPSLEELAAMKPEDLATVKNFVVRRPGYGMIEWEGQVDVRGANLDRIISIRPKDVAVYEIDEVEGTKPEEGTKLNRPAKITFYDVWPRSGPDASQSIKERQLLRLKAKANQIGAEFVSYDMDNGVWKFRVAHFSRYCLEDDWSDDETLSPTPQQEERRSAAMEVSDSEETDAMDIAINENAEKAAYELLQSVQKRNVVSKSTSVPVVEVDFGEIEGETYLEHFEEMILIDAEEEGSVYTTSVHSKEAVKHFCRRGLVNHASSWTPSNKVWRANSTSQLDISTPARSLLSVEELIPLLETQLDCCKKDFPGGESFPPIFSLGCPLLLGSDILRFENSAQGQLRHAFTLLSRLLPHPVSPEETKGYPFEERRVVAVREALAKICADDLAAPVGNTSSLPIYALAGGAVQAASDLALGSGDRETAAFLVAKSGGTFDPISALKSMKSDAKADWRHELATIIDREPDKPLAHYMTLFEQGVSSGKIRISDVQETRPSTQSFTSAFFYRLIELFSDSKIDDLRPLFGANGIAGSLKDLSSSFHIASLLLASNASWGLPVETLDSIVEGYVAQLIGEGLWHWAVFVTLYSLDGLSDYETKFESAKSIVLRFYNNTETDQRSFLEKKLEIPAVWFEEALCNRALQEGNHQKAVRHMLSFAQLEAIRLYDHWLLPKDFFVSENGYSSIRKSDDFTNIPNSLTSAVRRYLDFEEELSAFQTAQTSQSKTRAEELYGKLNELVDLFKHQVSVPLVIYKKTELTGKNVIAVVRERLDRFRTELEEFLGKSGSCEVDMAL